MRFIITPQFLGRMMSLRSARRSSPLWIACICPRAGREQWTFPFFETRKRFFTAPFDFIFGILNVSLGHRPWADRSGPRSLARRHRSREPGCPGLRGEKIQPTSAWAKELRCNSDSGGTSGAWMALSGLVRGGEHHGHASPHHPGYRLDLADVSKCFRHPLHDVLTMLGVRHLATAKDANDLDLVAGFEEPAPLVEARRRPVCRAK